MQDARFDVVGFTLMAEVNRSPSPRLNRSDALEVWHGVMLDGVTSSAPDLSARQMVILTSVYLHSGPHTVRSLAKTLGVTKAVVTRALDTLAGYGFLARADDPRDGRSVVINRTPAGSQYLTELGNTIVQTLKIVEAKRRRSLEQRKDSSFVSVEEITSREATVA